MGSVRMAGGRLRGVCGLGAPENRVLEEVEAEKVHFLISSQVVDVEGGNLSGQKRGESESPLHYFAFGATVHMVMRGSKHQDTNPNVRFGC